MSTSSCSNSSRQLTKAWTEGFTAVCYGDLVALNMWDVPERAGLTCSLWRGCAHRLLSTELAEADTFPLGSFSSFTTAPSPSFLRLQSAGRFRAWTITSWSGDARLCARRTVGGTPLPSASVPSLCVCVCVRACSTFFGQLAQVCVQVTDVVGIQVRPQLEQRHRRAVLVALASRQPPVQYSLRQTQTGSNMTQAHVNGMDACTVAATRVRALQYLRR